MMIFFQDYGTDRILSVPDINIVPNKDERVKIGDVWYVVVERTFNLGSRKCCSVYVKEE